MKMTVILLKISRIYDNLCYVVKSTNLYVVCSNEINYNNCSLLNKIFKTILIKG